MRILVGGVCAALAILTCGCCNVATRSSSTNDMGPVLCAPHPYYCTGGAIEILGEPFADRSGPDGIAGAFIAVTYPVWVVSAIADVALDTVFIPVDGITALMMD